MSAAAQSSSESLPVARMRAAFEQLASHDTPVRQKAFTKFAQTGFPTPRDEQWKYTNLRRLESREFALGSSVIPADLTLDKPVDAYEAVFVNGHYQSKLSTLPNGADLKITSIAELQKTSPEQVTALLSTSLNQASAMADLNTALTHDGLLIELAPHACLDKPLYVSFISTDSDKGYMAHPRIAIHSGAHSQMTVMQRFIGSGSTVYFNNVVTTIQLDEGAQLEHCLIQNENHQGFHIHFLQAELAAHASLTNHHFNLGAALARADIHVLLKGTAASATLNGLQFATGNQHHDSHLKVEHCVPHTQSHEDYRGIADERGRIVFNGKVMVHEKAVKTDAQQSSRNLLLSNTAEIDTKPELEIYNDDVKCAHGATVGQLDATALFYLRSRGLDENQARSLLTHAFANHIIDQVPVAALRQQLTELSHARFGAPVESGS